MNFVASAKHTNKPTPSPSITLINLIIRRSYRPSNCGHLFGTIVCASSSVSVRLYATCEQFYKNIYIPSRLDAEDKWIRMMLSKSKTARLIKTGAHYLHPPLLTLGSHLSVPRIVPSWPTNVTTPDPLVVCGLFPKSALAHSCGPHAAQTFSLVRAMLQIITQPRYGQ